MRSAWQVIGCSRIIFSARLAREVMAVSALVIQVNENYFFFVNNFSLKNILLQNFQTGGPVTFKINGVPTVVGAVSFYTTCDVDPQGFARVDRYLDWISSKTGIAIRST